MLIRVMTKNDIEVKLWELCQRIDSIKTEDEVYSIYDELEVVQNEEHYLEANNPLFGSGMGEKLMMLKDAFDIKRKYGGK